LVEERLSDVLAKDASNLYGEFSFLLQAGLASASKRKLKMIVRRFIAPQAT
jgi:hypothetical protein